MIKKPMIALGLALLTPVLAFGGEYRETIRDTGAEFDGVKWEFSPECGEGQTELNERDNCSITFDNFYADSASKPRVACHIRVEVDLPDGWSMAPKAVSLEGDYQISENGFNWIETSFGLRNGRSIRFHNYDNPFIADNEPLGSDAFLLSRQVPVEKFSPCGGVAVFEGDIILNAVKGRNDKFVSEINMTQQNNENPYGAEWGWVYKRCNEPETFWTARRFQTVYTAYNGKEYKAGLWFDGRRGWYESEAGFTGYFTDVKVEENGALIKGNWQAKSSRGWFWFKTNDLNDPKGRFFGQWGDKDGKQGRWNGRFE